MKKVFIAGFLMLAVISISAMVRTGEKEKVSTPAPGKKIPSVVLKTLDGGKINSNEFKNDGKPMVINFWATWCAPCKKELDNIAEVYADWQKETGVKIIAISTDDSRTSSRVAGTVESKGWAYEVYIDENKDFSRALGVNMVPHTFLVDGNGNIVWEHNNYVEGDEEELLEKIKELTSKN